MSTRRSRAAALISCFLLAFSATPAHTTQDKPRKEGAADKARFLVARPDLGDPLFKESVVLMFPSSVVAVENLVVGLIINRPARVPLGELFPNDKSLKNRTETAYFGGPVDPDVLGAVFRSSQSAKQATLLFGDIYVSFDSDFIKQLLNKPEKTPDLRLFVGRSQWTSAQLENEMNLGAWYSLHAETSLIFTASPQLLWRTLFGRAEPGPVARLSDAYPPAPPSLTAKALAILKPLNSRAFVDSLNCELRLGRWCYGRRPVGVSESPATVSVLS